MSGTHLHWDYATMAPYSADSVSAPVFRNASPELNGVYVYSTAGRLVCFSQWLFLCSYAVILKSPTTATFHLSEYCVSPLDLTA
jgi:hypothetical protein